MSGKKKGLTGLINNRHWEPVQENDYGGRKVRSLRRLSRTWSGTTGGSVLTSGRAPVPRRNERVSD